MFFEIELLYFVVMIATFVALLIWAKVPSGLCLMAGAVVGAIASAIFSQTEFGLRYFVEGAFGYFDTILIITTAMIFMGAMQSSGALEYVSAVLVKTFRKTPSLLLIAFMLIIMFPAMVTGSSLASAISAGALIAPIMIKWGIPKAKAGAIVAIGSVLGMIAPPVNVPAMVICDVVDIPYTGFALPLLLLTIPLAIVAVLILGRQYVKPISADELDSVVDTNVLKELNWTVCIPLFVLILLIIAEMIWSTIFGSLAMPAMFVISTIIACCVGRKLKFWQKQPKPSVTPSDSEITVPDTQQQNPNCIVEMLRQGVHKSFSAIGLLIGVGMFMEILTLSGARGFFVVNAVALPNAWKYVGMALTLPIFGGISAFGSASILGGPFVMALNGIANNIIVTCGLSLLAAVGEFLPPTAMSAKFAADIVQESSWSKISKASIPAIIVTFGYALIYILFFGPLIHKQINVQTTELVLLAIMVAIAIAFAVVWSRLVVTNKKFAKYACKDVVDTAKEDNA